MKTLSLVLCLALSACGAVPWNKQNYAGIEEWRVRYSLAEDGNYQVKDVHYINGKEANGSEVHLALGDGSILKFTGDGVKAFEGQKIRGEVEQVVAEKLGEAIDSPAVQAIVNSIMGVTP